MNKREKKNRKAKMIPLVDLLTHVNKNIRIEAVAAQYTFEPVNNKQKQVRLFPLANLKVLTLPFCCCPSALVVFTQVSISPLVSTNPRPLSLKSPSLDHITPNMEPLIVGQRRVLDSSNQITFTITFTFQAFRLTLYSRGVGKASRSTARLSSSSKSQLRETRSMGVKG